MRSAKPHTFPEAVKVWHPATLSGVAHFWPSFEAKGVAHDG
jgi:hypothetical protein